MAQISLYTTLNMNTEITHFDGATSELIRHQRRRVMPVADEQALYDMELIPVDDDLLPEMAELAKSYLRYSI